MNAKVLSYTFDYIQSLESLIKNMEKERLYLIQKKGWVDLIESLDFPCEIQYQAYTHSVDFYAPLGGWHSQEEYRNCLTLIRHSFDIKKLNREFNAYDGTYRWEGKAEKVRVTIHSAEKPPECKIVKVQETVTKYKSVCSDEEAI